jgi:hypothetical protein
VTPQQAREMLRRRVRHHGDQRRLARKLRMRAQHLCDMIAGRMPLGRRVLRLLKLVRRRVMVVTYHRAGRKPACTPR